MTTVYDKQIRRPNELLVFRVILRLVSERCSGNSSNDYSVVENVRLMDFCALVLCVSEN